IRAFIKFANRLLQGYCSARGIRNRYGGSAFACRICWIDRVNSNPVLISGRDSASFPFWTYSLVAHDKNVRVADWMKPGLLQRLVTSVEAKYIELGQFPTLEYNVLFN